MLWNPYSWGTYSRGRKAAYITVQPTLHVPTSKQIFPWRTSIKASFSSDCLNHCFVALLQAIRCAGNYSAFLGGRNKTELHYFEKGKKKTTTTKKTFLVSKTVSKRLQCPTLPACSSGLLNWTFQIIWMPAQIIWLGLDCWQVGCYFGNFEFGKKISAHGTQTIQSDYSLAGKPYPLEAVDEALPLAANLL